jgi:hypothetical protein
LFESEELHYIESQEYKNGKPCGYKPLQEEILRSLLKNTIVKNNDILCDGFITRRIISCKWEPMNKQVCFIIPKKMELININGKKLMFHCPAMLFKINDGELYVYALDRTNISPISKLYHAPFRNVYEDGRVCLGQHDISKNATVNDVITKTENWFYKSQFNQLHHKNYTDNEINEHYDKDWKKEELKTFKNKRVEDIID